MIKVILLLFSLNIFAAYKGIIRVFEAPLYKAPNFKSPILQKVKHGTIIAIHAKHASNAPYTIKSIKRWQIEAEDIDELEAGKYIDSPESEILIKGAQKIEDHNFLDLDGSKIKQVYKLDNDKEIDTYEFLTTLDKNGNVAYIPRKFVKIVYNDQREYDENISRPTPDLTDHRLKEPIPSSYPFKEREKIQTQALVGFSPSEKGAYNYNRTISTDEYGTTTRFRALTTKELKTPLNRRLSFGGLFEFSYETRYFAMADGTEDSGEQETTFLGGPYFIFNHYINSRIKISTGAGIFLERKKVGVVQSDTVGNKVYREYSGFSIASEIDLIFGYKLNNSLSLIGQIGTRISLPATYTTNDTAPTTTSVWTSNNTDDYYEREFVITPSVLIGLQFDI